MLLVWGDYGSSTVFRESTHLLFSRVRPREGVAGTDTQMRVCLLGKPHGLFPCRHGLRTRCFPFESEEWESRLGGNAALARTVMAHGEPGGGPRKALRGLARPPHFPEQGS